MLLLGEELASLAFPDEFFSMAQSCRLVEGSSESFSHQRMRGLVVAADTLVDLLQDVLAFSLGYALHEYSGSRTPPVELVPD
jgi:hypothetical protein